jgi:hypothetical protein
MSIASTQKGALCALAHASISLLFLLSFGTPLVAQDENAPPTLSAAMRAELEAIRLEHRLEIEELRRDYESRMAAMESQLGSVRAQADDQALAGAIDQLGRDLERRGISNLNQVTLFDNRFNPAISLIGDFIFATSDREDSFNSLDRFSLRSAELGIYGRVDPDTEYYGVLHFDEEEIELEEAFILHRGLLAETSWLKAGRFNRDFGRFSILHDHDLPFVDKPAVLQEYVGGALRGTGVELHHWEPLGDSSLVRFSAGIANDLDGDGHPIVGPSVGEEHGHEDEELDAFGERNFDNFAFTGRMTAQFEVGGNGIIQVGTSLAWAPNARTLVEDEDDPDAGSLTTELEKLVWGVDLSWMDIDPSSGRGFRIITELFLNHQEFASADTGEQVDIDAFGGYLYGEYYFGRQWSLGASANWFERAEDVSADWFDAGLFVTFRINEFNRLRFEARYVDDELSDEDYLVGMLQWTVILGSHGHGIPW